VVNEVASCTTPRGYPQNDRSPWGLLRDDDLLNCYGRSVSVGRRRNLRLSKPRVLDRGTCSISDASPFL